MLNLANNHAGDFGMLALLDTVRAVRRAGALPVGAGATLAAARRPQVVSRLGLRVAFVGFSDIGPASFFGTANSPGTSNATFPAIAASVRDARRQADEGRELLDSAESDRPNWSRTNANATQSAAASNATIDRRWR